MCINGFYLIPLKGPRNKGTAVTAGSPSASLLPTITVLLTLVVFCASLNFQVGLFLPEEHACICFSTGHLVTHSVFDLSGGVFISC